MHTDVTLMEGKPSDAAETGRAARVYRYGLLPPTENADLVRSTMRGAHRYRNLLIEIERARRAAVRDELPREAAQLQAAAEAADDAAKTAARIVKAHKAKTRSRNVPPDLTAALLHAKLVRKTAMAAWGEMRRSLRVDMAPWLAGPPTGIAHIDRYLDARRAYNAVDAGPNSAVRMAARTVLEDAAFDVQSVGSREHPVEKTARFDAINLRSAAMGRLVRKASEMQYGTYLLVEAAMEAAAKTPLFDGVTPKDPRFVRWTGDGQIGVQIQGGMAAADVFGSDTRLRIDRVDERAWYDRSGGVERLPGHGKRKAMRTVLHMRVGSDKRAPVWARWPMIMHRPLPDGSVVKSATVSRRMRGPREEWSVEITVILSTTGQHSARALGTGAVAIDLGWRVMGDALRVCAWHAEDGNHDEVRLTADELSSLRRADELRSTRDTNFDLARSDLVTWLAAHPDVPKWLRDETRSLSQWRSAARLAKLARTWAAARFIGDEEAFGRRPTREEIAAHEHGPGLEGWRYHDHHLWTWETSQRTKSLRRRREFYRRFAAWLASRYATVVVEKFDLRTFARRPAPATDEEKKQNETARSNRHLAATSELRSVLLNAFRSRGGSDIALPAYDTTRECNACNHVEIFDAAATVSHMCTQCGERWDQDDNAALNLLDRWRERPRDVPMPPSARDMDKPNEAAQISGSRPTKMRPLLREKQERLATARE